MRIKKKDFDQIQDKLSALEVAAEELTTEIRQLAAEFDGEWDDRSERWQESERGQVSQEWIESLHSIADDLDSLSTIEELKDRPDA